MGFSSLFSLCCCAGQYQNQVGPNDQSPEQEQEQTPGGVIAGESSGAIAALQKTDNDNNNNNTFTDNDDDDANNGKSEMNDLMVLLEERRQKGIEHRPLREVLRDGGERVLQLSRCVEHAREMGLFGHEPTVTYCRCGSCLGLLFFLCLDRGPFQTGEIRVHIRV